MKYKLKELLTIHNGKDYRQQHKGIIPVYGTGGVMTHIDAYLYTGESILLPRKGSLSNIMYVNGPFWTVDTIYWTTVNTHLVNAKYLYYYLSLLDLSSRDTGSALPSMTYNSYYELDIDLPSLSVQQKIAQSIDNIDQKIAINNTISKELESMAKTIYDYWFLQFEFPDKDGKPYRSNGGKMIWNDQLKQNIPKGWKVKRLGDYAEIQKGKLLTAKETNLNGSYKVVSAGLDYSYHHDQFNNLENTITISASGANAGFVRLWYEKIYANDCTTVRGNSVNETDYIFNFLKSAQDYLYQQARGSAQPHVYPKDIENIKIVIPPENIMNRFSMNNFNDRIALIVKENQQLKSLRDFLLPMLMNGQVTIKD
ncbi:restriction endonuclease subunit S [Paenibacillus barengoltzii]|uniref:restriction endonuclease subunit S n=1 Tax=Paenibacillus barengoltzii TaxID=343517 RepID=UPI003F8C92BE